VDDHVDTVVVRDESIAVSYVQPHPDGVLLAGARCGLHASGAEQNAVVYDWNGSAQARLTLGDGIQDLRVTPSGQIWAAYFDEGVLGNHGWGEHGATPIGAAGLVAFSSAGDVAFKYDPRAARTDMIVDAYALNVAGDDDVWLYFYTEFPIVRIQRGQYRVWRTEVRGAWALAVRDHHALLFGDYQHRSGAHVLELQRGGVTALRRTVPVVDDSGEPLDRAGVWGVAGNLYFLKDRRVLVAEDW